MIRNITDFYSYIFQEENDVTAVYFKTFTGTEYRIYFYPVYEYFDYVSENDILCQCGYFFGFTKLEPNETKNEPIDFKIRNTIIKSIEDFFDEKGIDKVLIFDCDDNDGKNFKRANCFEVWYTLSQTKTCFNKHDDTIIVTDDNGDKVATHYMGLIIECDNPNTDKILSEFQRTKESFITSK